MSSPNRDSNALQVLADTASDDELRNRYDASKHPGRSSSGSRDYYSSSSDTKEDDDLGRRGSDVGISSNGRKAASKAKKDGLRKGKWMEEEEEYTTRVIHHFSSGLIALPEGKTLRTFLADKLKCDPMRITKKFAGASCLSKKIHTLCERPQFTPQEIEAARIEIERLEERFLLRLEHGPGVALPPMETKAPVLIGGSVTSLPRYTNSPVPKASSVCSASGSTNSAQMMPNAQASLALLAYNAQLAAASNPASALPFGAASHSNQNPNIHQPAPAPPPAPVVFANLKPSAVPAPVINLQALLQQNSRVQPTNPQPETHPDLNNSQQLTQLLVSQLLTQLQTLATVSPGVITQLHNQLFPEVSPPAPQPTQSQAAGMDIAALLQNVQAASQAPFGNFDGGMQHFQMPQALLSTPAIPAGLAGPSNVSVQSSANSQFTRPLASQVQPQQPSNTSKAPNNPISDLLAQLKRGHDDALQRARKESKKRKKGKFKMPSHSSSSLTNGSSESENQKQLRYEHATVVSSESGSRSKIACDTEGSASSADVMTSDTAKGCESSSSNSGSDEEKDSRKGPLRKRFKASRIPMTHRALQDHDERMARNAS